MTSYDIFLNYRRDDTQPMAVVLELLLREAFTDLTIFLDQEGIQAEQWPDKLRTALTGSRMVITLVGPRWLSVRNQYEERRIDEPGDWVRREIEMAVEQKKIIVPLRVDNARLPKKEALQRWPLLHKWLNWNAERIAWETFRTDFERLKMLIARQLGKKLREQASGALPANPLDVYPLPPWPALDPFEADEVDCSLAAIDPKGTVPRATPYFGLRYFRRKDARLFFGRTLEILEFLGLVKNPDIRIIKLFGHSGVGKSSFLAAGILPRMEPFRHPFYARRNRAIGKGLATQLEMLLAEPKKDGLPAVYILDQAEEMFTDPLPGEPQLLMRNLSSALVKEPQATFVFGYRSDFQLEMSDLLMLISDRQEELPLRPLAHAALVEAIEGVWRDERLQSRFMLDLEPGFAEYVARDLLSSEHQGTSAILQNRLLWLYEKAITRRTPDQPAARLTIADYRALQQAGRAEEELLDYQLRRLRDHTNGQWPDAKPLLEALDRFVLDKPTAGTLPLANLDLADNRELYQALRRVNLLAELRTPEPALRLSHDLLAEVVRRRYADALHAENLGI